jgi:hypothetical protein
MTTNNPTATSPSFEGFLEGLDDDAYHNALADGVIDDIIFDENHDEKVAGNILITVDELDDLDEDGEEEQGGDSDEEGEEADLHNIALARRLINDDLGTECLTKSTAEQIVMKHFGTVLGDTDDNLIDDDVGEPSGGVDETLVVEAFKTLTGAPEGWLPPSCPVNFGGYKPKAGEPSEEELDNPAGWSMYTFTPSYNAKTKKYDYHTTPTGARVVPANARGNRFHNGWEFHYQNWTGTVFDQETYSRTGAKYGDLKPDSRKGCLDANILRKHGLTPDRMRSDPMFFYQLLFPFCAPSDSDIAHDHRMPYFSNISVCTNMYAMWKGAGSGYGHDFSPVAIQELVHWTAVPLRNGALDGKPSTLVMRWKEHDPRYDPVTAQNITFHRWRQIKRYFKLSMGIEEKKRGQDGYDPCVKYDYIYRCLVHNMNYVTKRADADITIDETTWGFTGYSGDAGGRLMNKPKCKGNTYHFIWCLSFIVHLTCIRPIVQPRWSKRDCYRYS